MILSDTQIAALLEKGLIVNGYEGKDISPASLDLHLGDELFVEGISDDCQWTLLPGFKSKSQDNPYFMDPNEFVLIATREVVQIPLSCAGEIKIRSSAARKGYTNALATWCDPGFRGAVTLELKNYSRVAKLPLYPGLSVGQLILHRLETPSSKGYCGRYQGDLGTSAAKEEI